MQVAIVQVADVMYKQGETQFSGVKKKKKSKPDEGSVSGRWGQVQSGWFKIVHLLHKQMLMCEHVSAVSIVIS